MLAALGRRLPGALALLLLTGLLFTGLLTACGGGPVARSSTDWAPAAHHARGLRMLAQSDASGFRLFTRSGRKTFLPGVNLGSTTPLHQPGEVGTIPGSDYRRWLGQMGALGIRVVRIYTLLPPAFYAELAAYNRAHRTAPLYLVQGVYLPDETYTDPHKSLYTPAIDRSFTREIRDIEGAVHGDLSRPQRPGRAGGHYTADVSPWLLGWIVGIELDPYGVRHTDRADRGAPYRPGRYFRATPDATATERWLARHMDELAALEKARGETEPIAFANWPTDDPLHHPVEPLASEDLVSIDANHVLPTAAWPGGTFASFHAYPYYPDFQRYEPTYARTLWHGKPDRYAGYLMALKRHFAPHMPLLVTEFGVPSSLGSAHYGTNGRDQGDHTEQAAMAMDADMMRMMQAKGIGGAFVFEWADEWFKKTWNTEPHQLGGRRQLWHDPLTNEQWFGLMATDPDPVADAAAEAIPPAGPYRYLYTWADASWVHLDVTLRDALPHRLTVEADVVPGRDAPDYRVVVDPDAGRARLFVRKALDPIRLDTPARPYRPDEAQPWHLYEMITNRADPAYVNGPLPAEYDPVGNLVEGSWDPKAAGYDSLATWNVDEARKTIHLRIPWSMLGLADPSSRTALGPGTPARTVAVPGMTLHYDADGARTTLRFDWPTWNYTRYHERLKAGIGTLEAAFRDLAP